MCIIILHIAVVLLLLILLYLVVSLMHELSNSIFSEFSIYIRRHVCYNVFHIE